MDKAGESVMVWLRTIGKQVYSLATRLATSVLGFASQTQTVVSNKTYYLIISIPMDEAGESVMVWLKTIGKQVYSLATRLATSTLGFASQTVVSIPEMETQLEKSCCMLSNNVDEASQGTIFQHQGPLYLLTCHHVIPSGKKSSGWRVSIYPEESNDLGKDKSIGNGERSEDSCLDLCLDEGIVGRAISCCGEDGILGKYEHFNKPCPFDLDFILLELNSSKLEKMRSKFVDLRPSIDAINVLERDQEPSNFFQDSNVSCFYMRKGKLVINKEHYFSFPTLPTGPLKVTLLRDWSYQVSSHEFVKDDDSDVCGGFSSGAPMYATHKSNQPVLYGMHTCHGGEEDDDVISDEFLLVKSFNTNFIWVLYLINLYSKKGSPYFPDFPLRKTPMHIPLLWAVFLRYEKNTSMLKEGSLLVKIAQEIYDDLVRSSHAQAQLEGEEKKMFDLVEQFLTYEDPEKSFAIGLEGASIESSPESTCPSQTTGLVSPQQSFATEMTSGGSGQRHYNRLCFRHQQF
ncbi:PREDICTED: uncharacterized protein LOC109590529 [Amphimedon queenslandica]|uniref:Uncharacterized protein n=1 Tax=Amphimedon queenslandica TaxID=400682 RepID=A0AAN0JXR0_AMPQE|nr:PREDICTED: uncharacterized protein LOC109590529 [Amphimedon queenslandica]|eukprot:XP_019861982.1 PREDICTED: uncharacterized protein LOC109590529 [Amphimedon queenslandica]